MMMSKYLANPSGLANSDAWSYTTVTEDGYRPGGRSGKALVPLWRPPEPLSETIFLVSVRGIRVPRHLMGSLPILIFFFILRVPRHPMGSLPILIFIKANITHNLTTGPVVSWPQAFGSRPATSGLPHRVVQVSFPCELGNVIRQRSGCE